jgi:hypothetical protein
MEKSRAMDCHGLSMIDVRLLLGMGTVSPN